MFRKGTIGQSLCHNVGAFALNIGAEILITVSGNKIEERVCCTTDCECKHGDPPRVDEKTHKEKHSSYLSGNTTCS